MPDLVGLVMEAAATELLYEEAAQIDREVQQLLAEAKHASAQESRGTLLQRLIELLERRGEIARKAPLVFEDPPSERPREPEPVG